MGTDSRTVTRRLDDCAKYATLSPCGRYRYRLHRQWTAGDHNVLWLMLNPSTADATNDDPTIRRCMAFSKAWGYEGMYVGNLYALRSTDPEALRTPPGGIDPVGPENHKHLREMAAWADLIVAGWGSHKMATPDVVTAAWKATGKNLWCLGYTKNRSPRHPLYVASATKLEGWMP